jgi:hypothetical protein
MYRQRYVDDIGGTVSTTSAQSIALALEDLDLSIRETQAALTEGELYEAWGSVYDARVAVETAERQVIGLLRETGWTWERIGEAYGITKQAAQQRWGDR